MILQIITATIMMMMIRWRTIEEIPGAIVCAQSQTVTAANAHTSMYLHTQIYTHAHKQKGNIPNITAHWLTEKATRLPRLMRKALTGSG